MNTERLEFLLDRYVDEGLTSSEKQELEELLLSSPGAREFFWQHTQFHAALRRWGEEEWGRRMAGQAVLEAIPAQERQASRIGSGWRERALSERLLSWLRWAMPVGGVAILALVLLWKPQTPTPPAAANSTGSNGGTSATNATPLMVAGEPVDDGVAVLTRSVGTLWAKPAEAKQPGAILRPGPVELKSGTVQLDFYDGASLIVQGPAEFDLISDRRVFVHYGRCSANVPELAHGFQVDSPSVALVDLGTRFGLAVSTNGPSEVHVFQGKVELQRIGKDEVANRLTQGQGIRVDPSGKVEKIASAENQFTTTTSLFAAVQMAAQKRLEEWRADSRAWSAAPDTLVHFLCDASTTDMAMGVLRNHAQANLAAGDGTVVGCGWSEGRWPGSHSLEFRGRGDRVRLNINGEYDQLTFLAWVRIDSLPNRFNGLLLSDQGYRAGAIQWQITRDGRLKLTYHYADGVIDDPDRQYFESMSTDPILNREYWGQWVHLASVYDRNAGTVTHYINGEMEPVTQHVYQKYIRDETKLISPVALVPGKVEMGNWGLRFELPSQKPQKVVSFVSPIRYFNGKIDEFLLIKRALTASEIRKHYEDGCLINDDVLAAR